MGAIVMAALAAVAAWASAGFDYEHAVIDMPALGLAAALCLAGAAFALLVPSLVRRSTQAPPAAQRTALALMIAGGLAARLVLFASEPMLEDDYQRYLWDGGVVAAGLNPYAVAPRQARDANRGTRLGALAASSGPILRRVGHPGLKTIYPPVTQAAFALAHRLRPWSLTAWRGVVLVCDLAVLALLIALLAEVGRAPLWAALYWWNPIVIKELFNSGHMETVVMAPVLLALLLACRRRPVAAVMALGIATGAKIWPVLLLPLLLRPLVVPGAIEWRKLALALGGFATLMGLWIWPVLAGGLDATSGFVAYAANWQTNSAFFPAMQHLLGAMARALGATPEAATLWSSRGLRAALALSTAGLALWLARRPAVDKDDLVCRAAILTAALVLLSPAQYPWYAIWFLPFLAFLPLRTFLVLTATLPLYYAFFHFNARGEPEVFRTWIVWAIWIPAWIALVFDLRAARPGTTLSKTPPGKLEKAQIA